MTRRKYAVKQMPNDSLWLWGRMRDFERDGFFTKDKARIVSSAPGFVQADIKRIAPKAAEFFVRVSKEVAHASD